MLVGWWSFAVKGFWALRGNIYECVRYNRCCGNTVTEFLALWENIYVVGFERYFDVGVFSKVRYLLDSFPPSM
jgi:hypothetical protein